MGKASLSVLSAPDRSLPRRKRSGFLVFVAKNLFLSYGVPMTDETDWSLFRFPPPPSKRRSVAVEEPLTPAPQWASPPSPVTSWHLDDESFFIVHPVQRKKIDLNRVLTKRRLVKLCDVLKIQNDPTDLAALWRALDSACVMSFNMSLSETLAFGPEEWEWPSVDHFLSQPHMFDEEVSFSPARSDAALSPAPVSPQDLTTAQEEAALSVHHVASGKALSLEDLPESTDVPSP